MTGSVEFTPSALHRARFCHEEHVLLRTWPREADSIS